MSEEHNNFNSTSQCFGNVSCPAQSGNSFSGPVFVILLLMMMSLSIVIFFGNALVILAFKVDRSLRRQSNFYFLNLAISDFLVGAISIPIYIPYILTGRWTLGRGMCKLWLVVDYLIASASTLNIVLISYDRFLSVTRAISFRARQNMTRQAVIKMLAVWVVAFALYGPAIIFWELVKGGTNVPKHECYVDFFESWIYLLTTAVLEFFCPLVSVAFFNISIYLNIRKRRLNVQRHVQMNEPSSTQGDTTTLDSQASLPSIGKPDQLTGNAPQPKSLSRDRKIARSLAIIVGVFGVCWGPYIIMTIIRAACGTECVTEDLYEFSFWLLWLNSAINPFLYPLCHSSFRKAFKKILCPKRRTNVAVICTKP